MTFYILGNGFDLAHGLHTKYSDYKKYVEIHANDNNRWESIFDYYPLDCEFWSDVESNICNFNQKHVKRIYEIFGFTLLDNTLKKINNSFKDFILDIENKFNSNGKIFTLDNEAIFLNFNYTITLQQIYQINDDKIIHIHNNIFDLIFPNSYNRANKNVCILGHSEDVNEYNQIDDISIIELDEYKDFVKRTTKQCDENINNHNLVNFIEKEKQKINRVVYYGFSFSMADKKYITLVNQILPNNKYEHIIYYYVQDNEDKELVIALIKTKLAKYGLDYNNFVFRDCKDTYSIL